MFAFIVGLALGVWGTNTYLANQAQIQAQIANARKVMPGSPGYSNGFPGNIF